MKKYQLLIALFILSTTVYTQKNKTVQYAKLEDNPDLVSDKIIALSMTGQFGGETETTIGFEANALFKIQNKISVFGSINLAPINFSDFTSYDVEAGGLLKFRTKEKVKDVKIVTSWSDNSSTTTSYNNRNGKSYETTTRDRSMNYLDDKAIYRKELNLRGGLFSLKYSQKGRSDLGESNLPLNQIGVFGGIERSTKAAVISSIDGEKGITSGLTRIYADALITPVNRTNKVSNGVGVGGRAGFCIYMLPNKTKNASPSRLTGRQAYGLMFFKSEIGVRPTQGWFFMMGTGIMLYKNK